MVSGNLERSILDRQTTTIENACQGVESARALRVRWSMTMIGRETADTADSLSRLRDVKTVSDSCTN